MTKYKRKLINLVSIKTFKEIDIFEYLIKADLLLFI